MLHTANDETCPVKRSLSTTTASPCTTFLSHLLLLLPGFTQERFGNVLAAD